MPSFEAPCVELGSAPRTPSLTGSPSPSEISTASSPEPVNIRPTPMFRALTIPPPDPEQPRGQDELERRLPGYRRIVIPRELTLIELLKQSSGVTTDEEVLNIREVKLRVIADRVGLRRLHILVPRLRKLVLDGSAIASLRELGIGLTHLKILSINRCNLSSLDGVWGLGSLKELYAAGNRLQDLQPLAALQKLQTLDLSNNPLADSSRLWTLGVCSALRRLTLQGTPASDMPDYRASVASALPMLMYLDERPLHMDIEYESDRESSAVSSSDSELEQETELKKGLNKQPQDEDMPGPSCSQKDTSYPVEDNDNGIQEILTLQKKRLSRRPATTENAGVRPARSELRPRPRTAHDRPVKDEASKLQILNTLMDDDWLCSGSKLTSVDPMCGNLARALRRSSSTTQRTCKDAEEELMQQTMTDAIHSAAAEIPRAPKLEDWVTFRQNTGIDIDLDLNDRPQCPDTSKILDRLEQIERETRERYKGGVTEAISVENSDIYSLPNSVLPIIPPSRSDCMLFSQPGSSHSLSIDTDIHTFFDEVNEFHSVDRDRYTFSRSHDEETEQEPDSLQLA